MHIRFNRSLRGDYGRARAGDVKLVSKDIAKSLIARGLAVETEAPPEEAEPEPTKRGKGQKPADGGDAE